MIFALILLDGVSIEAIGGLFAIIVLPIIALIVLIYLFNKRRKNRNKE